MLLRAIEDKSFFPLGSDKLVQSDFQFIAGTNRDLTTLVKQGRFREDLLHRINVWSFSLPALKDRKEDIGPNLEFELRKFDERMQRLVIFTLVGIWCGEMCQTLTTDRAPPQSAPMISLNNLHYRGAPNLQLSSTSVAQKLLESFSR